MNDDSVRAAPSHRFALSVLMFLQFFLWGAWFVTLGPFMVARGFSGSAIGNAYSTAPIAAILAQQSLIEGKTIEITPDMLKV